MASKSANRRSPKTSPKPVTPTYQSTYQDDADLPEDAMAYEPHEDDDESGYITQATDRVREMTLGREGRVVVAALVGGFAIGTAIGCVLAGSRQRRQSWSDRLACEGLGRSLLDRLSNMMPESLSEKFGR
jgi:hypothetical protein